MITIAVLRRSHVLLLLLMTLAVTPAFSDSASLSPRLYGETEEPYDSRFLGVSYEYYSYMDLDRDSDADGRFPPRRAGATFSYGFPGLRMPRVRVGVGWEPERPLYISTGVEIPLFERFSRANGRNFGIFLLGDVVAGIPRGPRITGEATLVGLIPMGNIGGISVGAGATHRGKALVSIGIMTGVFPMDDRN